MTDKDNTKNIIANHYDSGTRDKHSKDLFSRVSALTGNNVKVSYSCSVLSEVSQTIAPTDVTCHLDHIRAYVRADQL
ncbi:MAG TPA: hypothetical protein VFJ05_04790 [Nitrososphaeraceae archaeon]|nr:hypothetical protein [Nitrososphaeraceae archaeon]